MTANKHDIMRNINLDKICVTTEGETRCLCCLPLELLQLILLHLSILDYLSCRAVCRCWRSSFLRCSVSFQDQTKERTPWVVFLRVNDSLKSELHSYVPHDRAWLLSKVKPPLYTIGKLGNSFTRRVFNIPELCGKLFLLSKYGWLLLFSSSLENSLCSSLFFFNPFSHAKIVLPFLDVSSLNHPAFGLSSSPASQDCIVFVISTGDQMATDDIKISICRRGEDAWITRVYHHESLKIPYVLNVVFAGGVFYCLHQGGHLSAFNVRNSSWTLLMGPMDMGSRDFNLALVSYGSTLTSHEVRDSSDLLLRIECDSPFRILYIKLKDPPEIVHEAQLLELDTFGKLIHDGNFSKWDPLEFIQDENFSKWMFSSKYLILRYPEKAFLSLGNKLSFDSFGLDSWYGLCEYVDDETKFQWRCLRMWPCVYRRVKASMTIAWLETRWVEPSDGLRWTTYTGS